MPWSCFLNLCLELNYVCGHIPRMRFVVQFKFRLCMPINLRLVTRSSPLMLLHWLGVLSPRNEDMKLSINLLSLVQFCHVLMILTYISPDIVHRTQPKHIFWPVVDLCVKYVCCFHWVQEFLFSLHSLQWAVVVFVRSDIICMLLITYSWYSHTYVTVDVIGWCLLQL